MDHTALCALSASFLPRAPWKILFFAGITWLCIYWIKFVRTYLRLTHSAGVAAAMLTIAALSMLIVMALGFAYRGARW